MAKTVSVAWELGEIQAAVEGARILVDGLRHQQFGTEHDEKSAPEAASATLSLVVLRLRELSRAIQGNVNPATTVWAHFNRTGTTPPQEDVYLREWSATRVLTDAEGVLARARAAVARNQPARRSAPKRKGR